MRPISRMSNPFRQRVPNRSVRPSTSLKPRAGLTHVVNALDHGRADGALLASATDGLPDLEAWWTWHLFRIKTRRSSDQCFPR
jgi:hypothetical protein